MNIPYQLSADGSMVKVPADQVHEVRLKLAQQGLPKGGNAGFELLDQEKFGLSQFSEQINYQRALEGELATLIERAGNGIQGSGSITAFYTVLTEGDDQQDPIADSARAILDGHIVLSRTLAESGHYPAIDIEASISRAMNSLVDKSHFYQAQQFKQLLSRYQRNQDLINIGAYAVGSDPILDQAIQLYPHLQQFLRQDCDEYCSKESAYQQLCQLFAKITNEEA